MPYDWQGNEIESKAERHTNILGIGEIGGVGRVGLIGKLAVAEDLHHIRTLGQGFSGGAGVLCILLQQVDASRFPGCPAAGFQRERLSGLQGSGPEQEDCKGDDESIVHVRVWHICKDTVF